MCQPVSLILIDIDNFKRVNDTYGHDAGDIALRVIADGLREELRSVDTAARYGGEEFAVILPGIAARDAVTVAQRLVEAVRGVTLRQAAGWHANVSIGVATWSPGSAVGRAAELMTMADSALYAAKAAGKDRVVTYPNSGHPTGEPALD
jgi:diguanylate cyclase (GGDEF)-like protein